MMGLPLLCLMIKKTRVRGSLLRSHMLLQKALGRRGGGSVYWLRLGVCERQYAVAVANGTVALDLALKGLGIGPGDGIIVTSRTFLASASCIVNAGAKPVFADVDRDSQNITADTVAPLVPPAPPGAIIAVHLAGWPCDMDGLN